MPCVGCKALTQASGQLTRCPEHPLKNGGFQFREVRMGLVEKKVRGKTVLGLEPVDHSKPGPHRIMKGLDPEWPALPVGNPARTPFLIPNAPRPVKLTHVNDKGWAPLARARKKYNSRWEEESGILARKKEKR